METCEYQNICHGQHAVADVVFTTPVGDFTGKVCLPCLGSMQTFLEKRPSQQKVHGMLRYRWLRPGNLWKTIAFAKIGGKIVQVETTEKRCEKS